MCVCVIKEMSGPFPVASVLQQLYMYKLKVSTRIEVVKEVRFWTREITDCCKAAEKCERILVDVK